MISVRPELVEIAASEAVLPEGLSAQLAVKVLNRIFLGEHTEYRVANDKLGEFMVLTPAQVRAQQRHLRNRRYGRNWLAAGSSPRTGRNVSN